MSNDVIAAFAEPTALTVYRRAAGAYVAGHWVQGALTTITVTAAVTPAAPDELKLVAAGQELKGGIMIYSDDELRTVDEDAKTDADVVVFGGQRWQVQKVEYRSQIAGLEHYRSVALLEDPT